jgi:hypothetical protein
MTMNRLDFFKAIGAATAALPLALAGQKTEKEPTANSGLHGWYFVSADFPTDTNSEWTASVWIKPDGKVICTHSQ